MANKKSILPRLEKKSNCLFKLIIPEDVENKIRHLCAKISKLEWSGTLFFDYEGNWEKGDLKIICKDIFLMDIGTSTYTEFDINPDLAAYMCDHPELLDCQMALIHSHNMMDSFLSGTDLNTLQEEGNKRNHFVSLIVNNVGNYTAAITRKITGIKKVSTFKYKSFGDKTEEVNREEEEESVIEWSELKIVKYQRNYTEIDNKIKELQNKKKKANKPDLTLFPVKPPRAYYSREDSLFDDNFMQNSMNFDIKDEPIISDELVESLTLQLLTGNILLDGKDIIPEKWALSMEKVFDKRFKGDLKAYKAFIEGLCDYLLFNPSDDLKECAENEYIAPLALAVEERLSDLPKNKYINALREILITWT